MRRVVAMVGLVPLSGCSGFLFAPSLVHVQTDRSAYTDTSTLVLTVKLLGGEPIGVGGCPPPSVSFLDSTAQNTWELSRASVGVNCRLERPSTLRLAAGDSVVAAIRLTGLTPGTYRAAISFGPGERGEGWGAASNSFEVH